MNHWTVLLIFAALLGATIAQTVSPAASPSASTSPTCNTLLLNASQPFDIFLLGEPANASASPSPSTSPAASGTPVTSASPAASASPAPSSSPTLNLTNTLIGGTVAVNGDAVIFNSLVGSILNCTSATPSPSSSPAASSSAPASSTSPATSTSPSPASSANVTLLVTGNLNSTNSQVGCNQSSLQAGANVTSSIDFESVRSQLLNTSRDLCGLPNNTGIQANLSEGGALTLTLAANASELSVINLNATDLAALRFLLINASSSDNTTRRFVVINILGSTTTELSTNTTGITTGTTTTTTTTTANATSSANATSAGAEELLLRGFGMSLEGLNSSQLLWNFCNATNINVQFLRLMGSVLAPEARLRLSNAGHEGSIVARSLEAAFTSQNPAPFEGFFCPSASPSPSPSASPAATSPSPSP